LKVLLYKYSLNICIIIRSFPLKAGGAVTLKLFAAPPADGGTGVEPRRGENLRVVVTKTKLTIPLILAGIEFLLKTFIILNETRFNIRVGANKTLMFNVIFRIEESGIFGNQLVSK
jgi:hypothetical protein